VHGHVICSCVIHKSTIIDQHDSCRLSLLRKKTLEFDWFFQSLNLSYLFTNDFFLFWLWRKEGWVDLGL